MELNSSGPVSTKNTTKLDTAQKITTTYGSRLRKWSTKVTQVYLPKLVSYWFPIISCSEILIWQLNIDTVLENPNSPRSTPICHLLIADDYCRTFALPSPTRLHTREEHALETWRHFQTSKESRFGLTNVEKLQEMPLGLPNDLDDSRRNNEIKTSAPTTQGLRKQCREHTNTIFSLLNLILPINQP